MFNGLKYYYNKTQCPQIMKPNGIQQIVIMPKMIFREDEFDIKNWKPFAEFSLGLLSGEKVVTIFRQYALGDIIQLIVVAREFKRQYKIGEIRIITSNRYLKLCRFVFPDIKFYSDELINWLTPDFGFVINLNAVLEKDHDIKNCECYNHRIWNMLDYLECSFIKNDVLNWSSNMPDIKIPELKSDLPMIGLQIRGSGKLKTLPTGHIKQIASELSKKYTVVLIDHSIDKGFEGENIINLCGKLNVPQVIKVLEKLDCCITMDSGVLWLAHIANCPIITLLASTRASERINLHPLYPAKAKGIDLSAMVNCKPCFETMINCKGKIHCMNDVDCDKIIKEINLKLKLIIGEK